MIKRYGFKTIRIHLLKVEISILLSLFKRFNYCCVLCQLMCGRFCVSITLAWYSVHADCTEIALLSVV